MSNSNRREEDVLSEEEAAILAAALRPEMPDPDRAARLKARVMEGIRKESAPESAAPLATPATVFRTIAVEGREWRPVSPGVEMCTLREDEEARSILLRMQPDSILLPHQHAMSEESLILEGDAWIGNEVYLQAGDYHFSPAGAKHPLLRSPGGCIVFVRCDREFRPRVSVGLVKRVIGGIVKRLSA